MSHQDAVAVLVPLGEAVTKHAPAYLGNPDYDADMDDSMVVDDVTDSAVNTHRTNKLNTRRSTSCCTRTGGEPLLLAGF